MNSRTLVILGMHRSGTSLTANWVSKCGLNLGSELLGSSFGNPKGHYEDIDFFKLHKRILESNNFPSSGLITEQPLINHYFNKKLVEIVTRKSSLNKQWGWKEPRTCLFIDDYRELLGDSGKYIIVYRPFHQVVYSLLRRDIKTFDLNYPNRNLKNKVKFIVKKNKFHENIIEKKKNHYLECWNFYNKKIISFISTTKKEKYIVTNQEHLLKEDQNIFEKLQDWNFDLKYFQFSKVFQSSLFKKEMIDLDLNPKLITEAIEIQKKLDSLVFDD